MELESALDPMEVIEAKELATRLDRSLDSLLEQALREGLDIIGKKLIPEYTWIQHAHPTIIFTMVFQDDHWEIVQTQSEIGKDIPFERMDKIPRVLIEWNVVGGLRLLDAEMGGTPLKWLDVPVMHLPKAIEIWQLIGDFVRKYYQGRVSLDDE